MASIRRRSTPGCDWPSSHTNSASRAGKEHQVSIVPERVERRHDHQRDRGDPGPEQAGVRGFALEQPGGAEPRSLP